MDYFKLNISGLTSLAKKQFSGEAGGPIVKNDRGKPKSSLADVMAFRVAKYALTARQVAGSPVAESKRY